MNERRNLAAKKKHTARKKLYIRLLLFDLWRLTRWEINFSNIRQRGNSKCSKTVEYKIDGFGITCAKHAAFFEILAVMNNECGLTIRWQFLQESSVEMFYQHFNLQKASKRPMIYYFDQDKDRK